MSINYDFLLSKANKWIIKEALRLVENECNLYISFHTNMPGVEISEHLREKYPEVMAIILQHQFENLEVHTNYFSVELSFSGKLENIKIPFSSISVFHDRDANFHLQLDAIYDEADSDDTISSFEEESDKVISIDKFLGKKG